MSDTPSVYYHVTSPENAESILKDGLRAGGDRHIYLLSSSDLRAIIAVATNQCGHREAVVIEVCESGITKTVKEDKVGEWFRAVQHRVRQQTIPARFLTKVCTVHCEPLYSPTASIIFGSNAEQRESMEMAAADDAQL